MHTSSKDRIAGPSEPALMRSVGLGGLPTDEPVAITWSLPDTHVSLAYPVGDERIVVKWGDSIPENVRLAAEANIVATTPTPAGPWTTTGSR